MLPELRLASPGITVYTFNRRRVRAHGGVVRFVYGYFRGVLIHGSLRREDIRSARVLYKQNMKSVYLPLCELKNRRTHACVSGARPVTLKSKVRYPSVSKSYTASVDRTAV